MDAADTNNLQDQKFGTIIVPVYEQVANKSLYVYQHCISSDLTGCMPSTKYLDAEKETWLHNAMMQPGIIFITGDTAEIYCLDSQSFTVPKKALKQVLYPRTTDYGVVVSHKSAILYYDANGFPIVSVPLFSEHSRFSFEVPCRSVQQYVSAVLKMQNKTLKKISSDWSVIMIDRNELIGVCNLHKKRRLD